MAQVQILLNQAGKSAGVAGQAREDFALGVPVAVSLVGGPYLQQFWSFLDKPMNATVTAQSAAGYVNPNASSTTIQPIDLEGTYNIGVVVDSGQGLGATPDDQAVITFYAGAALNADPTQLPRRQPAFLERDQHNVPDAAFPGGNKRGWAEEWNRWFAYLKSLAAGVGGSGLSAWARVALTGAGATLTSTSNVFTVSRTGVGTVTVAFSTPLPDALFAVVGSARGATGGSVVASGEATTGFTIQRADPFGALIDADFSFFVKR